MKKLTKAQIERRIEEINDVRLDALEQLAAQVREQIVAPVCRKRGWSYMTGNGRTLLYKDNITIDTVDEAILQKQRALIPTLDILNIEVGRDDVLGYYIADVQSAERKT